MTRTRTIRYVTLLSVVLALTLTAALAACGSNEPSGVTGPDRTASTPTETPASPTQTPTTPGSGDARPLPPIRLYLRLPQRRPQPPARPKRTGRRWLPSTTQRTVRTGGTTPTG